MNQDFRTTSHQDKDLKKLTIIRKLNNFELVITISCCSKAGICPVQELQSHKLNYFVINVFWWFRYLELVCNFHLVIICFDSEHPWFSLDEKADIFHLCSVSSQTEVGIDLDIIEANDAELQEFNLSQLCRK